jgi:tetratricopeptide (TPR) repeat protein
MAGKYRGGLKVAGSTLRGWLVDTSRPARRVRFRLIIDNAFQGTFVANRRRTSFVRRKSETAEDTHGFSIPIRRAWISGAPQAIRLEDPDDRELDLSLTARLGPAPNQNFDEHVVGGHIALGARDRALVQPAEEPAEDARRGVRFRDPAQQLLKKISALSDADLAALILAIERDILLDRIGRYDRAEDWQSASAFRRLFVGGPFENLLVAFGRSALKGHGHALAARILTAAAALFPQSFEASYQAGVANALQGEFEESVRLLRAADELEEGTAARARQELVGVLARMLRVAMPASQHAELRAQQLDLLGTLSASENQGLRARYKVPFAAALYASGRYDEAVAAADEVLAAAPNDIKALLVRAKSLIARNDVVEARGIYEQILELDRDNAAARLGLRALAGLVAAGKPQSPGVKRAAIQAPDDWVCVNGADSLAVDHRSMLQGNRTRSLGYVRIAANDGRNADYWRSEVLDGLCESGLIRGNSDLQSLRRWKGIYGSRRPGSSANLAAVMFGADDLAEDEERFLRAAAEHHAREGFRPILVGVRAGMGRHQAANGGLADIHVGAAAPDIRRFLLEAEVGLAHAISDVSIGTAQAVRFTNMIFICGLHPHGAARPAPGADRPVIGPNFSSQEIFSVFERADAIYAGSPSMQRAVEEEFGVRCPIVSDVLPN